MKVERRQEARDGALRTLPLGAVEGDWPERRRVIIEFPSLEKAKEWWDSPEYAKPKSMRRANSKGRLILLEGV